MMTLQRSIETTTAAHTVFVYLSDFSTTPNWDAGTLRCERLTDGPINVGARFHNVSSFRGKETELDYELVRYVRDRELVFVGSNKTVTSTDTISFTPNGTGTTITYEAQFQFHGLARFAQPFLSKPLNSLGDDTAALMKTTLDAL